MRLYIFLLVVQIETVLSQGKGKQKREQNCKNKPGKHQQYYEGYGDYKPWQIGSFPGARSTTQSVGKYINERDIHWTVLTGLEYVAYALTDGVIIPEVCGFTYAILKKHRHEREALFREMARKISRKVILQAKPEKPIPIYLGCAENWSKHNLACAATFPPKEKTDKKKKSPSPPPEDGQVQHGKSPVPTTAEEPAPASPHKEHPEEQQQQQGGQVQSEGNVSLPVSTAGENIAPAGSPKVPPEVPLERGQEGEGPPPATSVETEVNQRGEHSSPVGPPVEEGRQLEGGPVEAQESRPPSSAGLGSEGTHEQSLLTDKNSARHQPVPPEGQSGRLDSLGEDETQVQDPGASGRGGSNLTSPTDVEASGVPV